jgi:hypothetical protein
MRRGEGTRMGSTARRTRPTPALITSAPVPDPDGVFPSARADRRQTARRAAAPSTTRRRQERPVPTTVPRRPPFDVARPALRGPAVARPAIGVRSTSPPTRSGPPTSGAAPTARRPASAVTASSAGTP